MTQLKYGVNKDFESCSMCETDEHHDLDQAAKTAQAIQPSSFMAGNEPLIGTCLNTAHPTLQGRYLIQWIDASGHTHEKWLPSLKDSKPECYDRVLLQQPENWFEPLICGILDSLAGPKDHDPKPGPALTLNTNRALHILDVEGNPILQVEHSEQGPVLRLLNDDLNIEIKGRLRLTARDIELGARQGGMTFQAADDVQIKGEIIYLN